MKFRSFVNQSLLSAFIGCVLGVSLPANAQPGQSQAYKPDEVLVKFRPAQTEGEMFAANSRVGAKLLRKFRSTGWQQLQLPPGMSVAAAIATYKKMPGVESVEPNYVVRKFATPNDPSYKNQWALPKIQAPTAWDTSTGSSNVVVAVIDTGVDYNHPDLQANMWRNPGEIAGNGKDDDGNGFIDDVYGIDPANGDSDPMDDDAHGTHVAGIIGAVGNNGSGMTGVNWNVKIMALKFLRADGSGYTSDAIRCLDYVLAMKNRGVNVRVTNNSWGGSGYSSALKSAFDSVSNAGIISACAAGNNGQNNDTSPDYPASFSTSSIIAVAASDQNDNRPSWSHYGATSVDLAAPGVSILSTVRSSGFATYSGTSMAAPQVAGAAALMAAANGNLSATQIKNQMLSSVDVLPQWQGLVVSNGRLNLARAVGGSTSAAARQADLNIRNESELSAIGNDIYNTTTTGQARNQTVALNVTATYRIGVQNDGNASDSFRLTATANASGWSTQYFDANNNNISSAITGSGWTTATLAAGQTVEIRVAVTPTSSSVTSRAVTINAVSTADTTKVDAVRATTTLLAQPDLLIKRSTESDSFYAIDNVYQSTPNGDQIKSQNSAVGKKVTFAVRLQNDSSASRTYILKASESAASGWTVTYKIGTTGINSQIRSSGGRVSKSLSSGSSEVITVEVTPNSGLTTGATQNITVNAFLDAADVSADVPRDSVRAVVTVPPPLVVGTDMSIRKWGETNYIGDGVINTSGSGQSLEQTIAKGDTAIFYTRVRNTGNDLDRYKLKGSGGGNGWVVKYFNHATGADLTSNIVNGWTTPTVDPNGEFVVRLEIFAGSSTSNGSSKGVLLTAVSNRNSNFKDAVKATITVGTTTTASAASLADESFAEPGSEPTFEETSDLHGVWKDGELHVTFGTPLNEQEAVKVSRYRLEANGQATSISSIRYDASGGTIIIKPSGFMFRGYKLQIHFTNIPTLSGVFLGGKSQMVTL